MSVGGASCGLACDSELVLFVGVIDLDGAELMSEFEFPLLESAGESEEDMVVGCA